MITEDLLTDVQYFFAPSYYYGEETFNLKVSYQGQTYFVRERISRADKGKTDINSATIALKEKLMKRMLLTLNQDAKQC